MNSNGATQWLNGGSNIGNEVVTFELGAIYDVDSIHLWNWVFTNNTSTVWGVATVDISFSTDGTTFGSTETVSFVANPALNGPSTAQTQTFSTKSGVTHIQLHDFTALGSGNRVGFGEIRFGEAEAIPEPSSLALLGLGGLALMRRRRRGGQPPFPRPPVWPPALSTAFTQKANS